MENRARVCEQCGTQYPPNVVRCPQDGETTIAATAAYIPAGRSAAVLLGSFFAQEDLDSRATSAALVPPPKNIEEIDDFIVDEPEEEPAATRRALQAVDFDGQRKSLVSVYEPEHKTSFALKPVRSTIPPALEQEETGFLTKPHKHPSIEIQPTKRSSAATDPNIVPTSRASAVTDPEIKPTSRASATTDPEIGVIPIDRGESAAMTAIVEKKPTPKSSKATLADVEAPRPTAKAKASTAELKPVDPNAIDNWKIGVKQQLSSKVLKSVPLAQSGKRPSVTPKYIGAGLLVTLLCGVVFGLWSVFDHTVEKKEQLIEQAPTIEMIELSLRSNPSGARISGSINGEAFSPRFSPNTLSVPKGATVEVTFEYANYVASSDRFVVDSAREISVHLALAPVVSEPQPVATTDPKPVTTVSTKTVKTTPKITKTKTSPVNNTKTTPVNTTTSAGKKNPLPAKPEL
jgi:hypothetical protein